MLLDLRRLVILMTFFVADEFGWALSDDDSCFSYGPGAGSHVFPLGSNSGSHQLQYTKAVSEYTKHIGCLRRNRTLNRILFFQYPKRPRISFRRLLLTVNSRNYR